jgi:hypothetical protein
VDKFDGKEMNGRRIKMKIVKEERETHSRWGRGGGEWGGLGVSGERWCGVGVMIGIMSRYSRHGQMARGGHGLPKAKVSAGSAMPYLSTPWTGGVRQSSTPLDTPRRTPMRESGKRNRQELSVRDALVVKSLGVTIDSWAT